MRLLLSLAAGLGALALAASAENTTEEPVLNGPVLAELFTSQSCSSCPPAERFFNELAQTDGVVAIQWHVDYWDDLVHGRAGNWKDPFSSRANTERQRDYNFALRDTGGVYTPQAIVGGVTETVGSRAQTVTRMIAQAPAPQARIDVDTQSGTYMITVSPAGAEPISADAEIMLVKLIERQATDIAGGENKGLSVNSMNVAMGSDTLGAWVGEAETYRAKTMGVGYACAIIVQEKSKGRILAASYCP